MHERNDRAVRVVGVRFRRAGRISYFDPGDMELAPGQRVVVETATGSDCGEVAIRPKLIPRDDVPAPLHQVLREAGSDDVAQRQQNKSRERDAFRVCQEKIARHGLPMKLVSVEVAFDNSKILFCFTAEHRVDFRELVKDLASHFRTRIELRQIGVRDEAKLTGGLGPCGRELCCATWIREFDPVSIRMAKHQDLSLNPSKLSGMCGRLKCCLRHEDDVYRMLEAELPGVGEEVGTHYGAGPVVAIHRVKEAVTVQLPNRQRVEVKQQDLIDPQDAPEVPLEDEDNGSLENGLADGNHSQDGKVDAAPAEQMRATPESRENGSGEKASGSRRRRRRGRGRNKGRAGHSQG